MSNFEPKQPASPTETPLAHRAVRGGLWVTLSSYWTIGFGFLINVILTRLLTPEIFGTFALAMFFVQLFRLQPKLGLGYALAQHKELNGEVLGTYLPLELLAGAGGVLLTWVAAPILLALGYNASIIQASMVLSLVAFGEGLAGMGTLFMERELRFGHTSLLQSLALPISYIPAVWLALNNGGLWCLIAQTATFNILVAISVWWVVGRQMPQLWQMKRRFSWPLARHFLRFGVTIGVGTLAGTLLTQLDNFYIGTFVGVTALGFYDRAYRTAQWPSTLLNSFIARTVFYTYSRLQDDQPRLQKTARMVLWIIVLLAVPLALAIFISAPDLIHLIYGERWLPSAPFLRILIIYSVLRPLWENGGTFLIAIGKPRLTTTTISLQAGLLAVVGLPMTLLSGAIGTALAVGVAFVIGIVRIYRYIARIVNLELIKSLGIPLAVSVVIVALYLLLNQVLDLNAMRLWVRVALKIGYAMLGFYALMFLLQPRATLERLQYIKRLALRRE